MSEYVIPAVHAEIMKRVGLDNTWCLNNMSCVSLDPSEVAAEIANYEKQLVGVDPSVDPWGCRLTLKYFEEVQKLDPDQCPTSAEASILRSIHLNALRDIEMAEHLRVAKREQDRHEASIEALVNRGLCVK